MKFIFAAGLLMCMFMLRPACAQQGAVYPEVSALRSTLLALAAEQKSAFQNIKGASLYNRGTVQYYSANMHIVPADTPKIAEDTNPMQVYYSDFVAKGMTEPQSKDAFKKWQDLIKLALPGCNISPAGNQYPDLESRDVSSADGNIRFTLYRNGTGNACQVSITFMHKGAPGGGYKQSAQVTKVESVDAEGVRINGEEFARQLQQLIVYAKTGFKEIKGAKDKSEFVDKYSTSFKINGAISQELIDFPFLGMSYSAVYMEKTTQTRGNVLFEQLRKLAGQSLPGGFVDEGIKNDDRMKTATFSTNGQKLFVEVCKSDITNTVTVSVRKKDKY